MSCDLHIHSTCSDGAVPIERLASIAARTGLHAIALSDHDTLLSAQYAYAHTGQDGVELIPAVELTGYDFDRQHRVHLLCYYPDVDCPALREHCAIMKERRNACALQSAKELEQLYPQFTTDLAWETTKASGVLFKSGLMQALELLGLTDGSIYGETYHKLFGWNPRGIVLHSPEYLPVRQVLATAKASGGAVVFAHPTVYKSMPLLRELAAEGAAVVINYHGSMEKAKEVKAEIESDGGIAEIMQCNVADYQATEAMIRKVTDDFGRLDILVNNAGITRDGLLMKMSEEDYDTVLDTNLKGTFHCIRFAARQMLRQRGGRIINLSSVSGILGNAGQANYSASKAGVIGLTKSAARELASRGITVNAVAPGFIETEMTAVLTEKVRESAVAQIPMGAFGTAEDVAEAVAFLASDSARYITGQTIHVDGGMAM